MRAARLLGDLAGQSAGSFQIVRLLGSGGMGAVYLAKDSVLRRDVALKVIAKGDEDSDSEHLERFLREARAAARLIHPHVVQIFQIGETPELRFIAMEYVEGMNLRQAAKQSGGRLPEHVGIQKMREAADALQLAATLGICHRDIKPANLLVTSAGVLKIADFGLATQVGGGQTIGAAKSDSLEGTPFYMAPEQWTRAPITAATDIYSLGCTFYHLLVGATPYPAAREFVAALYAHCTAPVPDARASVPDLDPLLTDLIKRCMAKAPEGRPTSQEIVATLDDMLLLRRGTARASMPSRVDGAGGPPPGSPTLRNVEPAQETNAQEVPFQSHTRDVPGSQGEARDATQQLSYETHFGLKTYPFSEMRQAIHFWDGGPSAGAIRALGSQIAARQSPILLLGAPGSGKTLACEMLQHKLPGAHVFVVEPQLLFGADIFSVLSRQLDVNVSGASSKPRLAEAFLAAALPADPPDAIAIVVIDGVEAGDRDLLADLAEILDAVPDHRLVLILVGAENLPETLARSGAPARLLSVNNPVVLRPMTQQETIDYIDFRMSAIGGVSGLVLDNASRQLLYARSGGNPRLVNTYCHNALALAALKQEKSLGFDTIRLALKSKSYLTAEAARGLLRGR